MHTTRTRFHTGMNSIASKKRFQDLSPRARVIVSAIIAVSLVLIGVAQRDIQRRPAAEIRGAKALWRVVCLNGLGALGYFLFGRKGDAEAASG